MSHKNKILFVAPTLGSGGAERVLTLMANHWAEEGKDITIAVIIQEKISFELHPNIKVIGQEPYKMSKHFIQGLLANIKRVYRLRCIIKETKPDVIISFTTLCNTLSYFARIGLSTPLIISERTNPLAYPFNFVWQSLNKIAYKHANALVLQTYGIQKLYHNYRTPQYIIRNPLILPSHLSTIASYSSKIIITVGRLDTYKNVQMLVHAFAKTHQKDWSLWIVGRDGGEQKKIEQAVSALDIASQVHFLGNQTDVFSYLSKASIFAMTSRVEGYPNALLEAMAIGLPVVSTDCDFGPSEMIEEGQNGFIIPMDDVNLFSEKLLVLMQNESLLQQMGQNACKIKETHSLSEIMKQWNLIIESL
jgi:GalNAc-alpha-(1->4)-GalNAc-alpha-(1->3)-diNAcBac-PP-undecaprenol alpha-1,4-N-acetyl-D-galactosaminyltransferase